MEHSLFDYIVCACAFCLIVYGWGRFKRHVAFRQFEKAQPMLAEGRYRDAVAIYQGIASDMQREPEYWYALAVALAGAGSAEDSLRALSKLLALRPDHEMGLDLQEALTSGQA